MRPKKSKKLLVGVFFAVALLLIGGQKSSRPKKPRVIIAGSSCMGKMLGALSDEYNETQGGWVQPQLGGTELGLQALRQRVCDIASCSRELTAKEAADFGASLVAIDAIAIAVHPKNPIENISIADLRDIYSGRLCDWSQLGGDEMPIVVIGREAGSGTRGAFEAAIGLTAPALHGQEHSETGMLRTAVSMAPGAIGYLSFDYIDASVKQLSVGRVFPTEETVYSGQYPVSRGFWLCVRKDESRPAVIKFLDFATAPQGRNIIRSLGMLPFNPQRVQKS